MADRPRARYAGPMQMRFLLLAALGLGASCVIGGVLLDRAPAAPAPKLACPVLAGRLASADRIELTHAGQVLWLERRGAVWGLARQGGYPVRPGRAEALTGALLSVKLLKPATGTLDARGLGDPSQPGPAGGTLVRVLGTSGAVLCALVAGPPGTELARRPGDAEGWITNAPIPASADLDGWSQHTLPPLEPAPDDAVQTLLSTLRFTDVRPRPQIHAATMRTVPVALAGGDAVLSVGMQAGQAWLLVDGTTPWARRLAPYAFALPPDSALAAPPGSALPAPSGGALPAR